MFKAMLGWFFCGCFRECVAAVGDSDAVLTLVRRDCLSAPLLLEELRAGSQNASHPPALS